MRNKKGNSMSEEDGKPSVHLFSITNLSCTQGRWGWGVTGWSEMGCILDRSPVHHRVRWKPTKIYSGSFYISNGCDYDSYSDSYFSPAVLMLPDYKSVIIALHAFEIRYK